MLISESYLDMVNCNLKCRAIRDLDKEGEIVAPGL